MIYPHIQFNRFANNDYIVRIHQLKTVLFSLNNWIGYAYKNNLEIFLN